MTDDEYYQTSSDAGLNNTSTNVVFQMPQFSWMNNNAHGFGGAGSMFNLAGNNAGFNLGFNKPATDDKVTEIDATKSLEESKKEMGALGVMEKKDAQQLGQGFQQAGQQIANMYSGSSGPIFS